MSITTETQPDITAERLEEPAWLDEPRSPETAAGQLRRLGEQPATALPIDDDALASLWRGIRAEQGR